MAKKKVAAGASEGGAVSQWEWLYADQLPRHLRDSVEHSSQPLYSWRQLPDGRWQCTSRRPKVMARPMGKPWVYDEPEPARLGVGNTPKAAQYEAASKWRKAVENV